MMNGYTRAIVSRSTEKAALLLYTFSACQFAYAQSGAEFADDFSANSILYSADSFDEVRGSGSASIVDNNIVLTARQAEENNYGNIFVRTQEDTDSLIITAAFDSATSLVTGSNQEQARLVVEERIYNSIADGGLGDGSNIGDVQVRFDIVLVGDGSSFLHYCLGEQTAEGYQPVNVFDDGNSNCSTFAGVSILPDVDYRFGFSLDKASNELTLVLNDNTRNVTLPGTLYEAENPFTVFALSYENGPGSAQARVSSVTTDSGTDTISNATSLGRYRVSNNTSERSVNWDGEKLILTGRSTEDSREGSNIRLSEPTDYLEAVVEISSDTVLGDQGRHFTELRADLFNDTADFGFNDREGDVAAFITFEHDLRGTRRMEYCLRRDDDAFGDERTGLLDDGDRCKSIPILLALDTPYRASIDFDRDAPSVTFRVDGFTHTQAINSDIFESANKSMQVGTYPDGIADIQITVDDIRTAPAELTATEQAAGATEPAAFPPALDPASLIADSTLTIPVFDQNRALDFIDDFSTPTMRYGFWDGRERGQVAIGYSPSGFVEIQVNDSSDDDNNNYSEFYVDGPTDFFQARLSIASSTLLPVDTDASIDVRLQGTFYNDTANGGTDGRLGDVYVNLGIRARGDGRRQGTIYMERRNADGSRDEELRLIPDGENLIENFVPELDTEYTLTLVLDRENRTLTASIDDLEQVVDLPTEIFTAARSEKQVQISYRGDSGHGVGRIHAISTDVSSIDFANEQPLLGLYRPAFNAGYPGVEVVHEDGRVRMVVDSNQTEGRGADIRARGASDYLAATMLMSSETVVTGDGAAFVGIGGSFYSDLADDGTDSSVGEVFATVSLGMKANDGGSIETYAEYCAFRSTNENFTEVEQLIGGDDDCPRFSMPAMTDVSYDMSIELDRDAKTLTFTLGDEVQIFTISTEIFDLEDHFNGARVRARDGGIAVGYADNLSYSATPVALADSTASLQQSAAALDTGTDNNTGTGGTGGGAGDGSGGTGGTSGDDSGSSSSGSGGCSIASGKGDPLLPLMGLMAGLLVWRRRVVG